MPNQYVNKVVQSNGTTLMDISDTTAVASDVASGKYFYLATGEKVEGTGSSSGSSSAILVTKTITENGTYLASNDNVDGYSSVSVSVSNAISITEVANTTGTTVIVTGTETSGGTSASEHIIHFVFTDETTTDISIYYTDTFTASAITATTPTTYNNKTIETASLDGVVWYTRPQYEVLFNGSVTFGGEITEGTPYYSTYISELGNLYPTEGESYRITVDNIVYNCIAHASEGDIHVGNSKYAYGVDDGSDVPFVFYNGGYGGWNGWAELSPTEHTVKIERLATTQQ